MGAEGLDGPLSRGWAVSTGGRLRSGRIREHVETLLKAVASKQDLLARLRREGYWVSIWFHDTAPPDADEFAALSAELEALRHHLRLRVGEGVTGVRLRALTMQALSM